MMLLLCYFILYLIIFLFGAVIGNFLNVCIYRMPKEESTVRVRSHCMSCGTQLLKRDLIPIFSWIRLKGKCRSCGAKISFRYTLVEGLNAILYVLIFAWYGLLDDPIRAILVCLLFSALMIVFFMDLDTQLINIFVVGFIGLLGASMTVYDWIDNRNWISHILGAVIAFAPLILLVIVTQERAMGSGDAWLMLAAGLFLGLKAAIVALFFGLVLGSIFGMIQKVRTSNSQFAFGPYLALGTAISVFCGEAIANGYLEICGF